MNPTADVRKAFGDRLRSTRAVLGYTQEQMAYALGIRPARYSKYEIGRSEAPYDVLIGIARLAGTDLDYLIAGDPAGDAGSPLDEPDALLEALPLPAVVFDRENRILAYNSLYPALFPRELRKLLRRGTPQEVLLRAWAHAEGCTTEEVEALVRERLRPRNRSHMELRAGARRLRIAERVEGNRRLAVISDLSEA